MMIASSKKVQAHNPWAVIVGRGAHGKREAAQTIVEKLRGKGLRVGGVLTSRMKTDECNSYELVDQRSGSRIALAEPGPDPDICDLRFHPEAFERADAWCRAPDLDVVIIELGKLEAKNRGFWQTFEKLMHGPPRLVLTLVRPEVLADIGLRLPDPISWLDLTEQPTDIDTFVESIAAQPRAAAVFGVRGFSDSGKTRLVEQLLPPLIGHGLRVATVKHASHELTLDVRGKDSHRHADAGASRVLLVGPSSASLFVHEGSPPELQPWLPMLGEDADLILVEGFKRTRMPHVEIVTVDGAPWGLDRTSTEGRRSWLITRPPIEGDHLDFPAELVDELAAGIHEHLFGAGA